MLGMQIDLEPQEYRRGPLRGHPLDNRVFLRAAAISGVWFVACVLFGRYVDHGQPWYVIAAAASAPGFLLAYIATALDD